ncbi:MAG: Idiomarinaceae phage [Pseudomonadota bacterium]|jgi:DNA repair protein RadD
MTFALRPYQAQALDDLWRWFEANGDGDPVVEASVGAGKSVMIAELCRRVMAADASARILMCVHVKELVEQNLAKLVQVWPGAPVGVYSASVGSRQLGRAITYATIGSVARRAHLLGRVDLMIVDECHLISDRQDTMYRQLIDELRRYCPHMRVIGWTGTAFRGDGIWLTQQGLFTHVAARVTMGELLKQGFLAPLHSVATEQHIDTSGVRTSGADYVVSALAEVSDTAERVQAACAEIAALAADRKKWLVFAVTVDHAQHVAAELRSTHGVACAVVSATTPKTEREAHIAGLRSGRLRALVNVAVLTTGFDVPELDCIALLRATKSPVLYVQIAGRGMRTAPGKVDCLWLDFTDTTATLGPVDAIKGRARLPKREASAEGERPAMVKHCECLRQPVAHPGADLRGLRRRLPPARACQPRHGGQRRGGHQHRHRGHQHHLGALQPAPGPRRQARHAAGGLLQRLSACGQRVGVLRAPRLRPRQGVHLVGAPQRRPRARHRRRRPGPECRPAGARAHPHPPGRQVPGDRSP